MTTAVTRENVLAVAGALRVPDPDAATEKKTDDAVRAIIAAAASVGAGDRVAYTAYPTPAAASVAGVLIDVTTSRRDTVDTRSFAIVALAAAQDTVLDGSVVVTGLPVDSADGGKALASTGLSGDVWVSAPIDGSDSGVLQVALTSVTVASPAGDARPATPTPRTPAELAAAHKRYDAALRSARATYAKARRKAGSSKRRKKAAKAAYDKRRARAKAAYRSAVAAVPAAASSPSEVVAQALGVPTTIITTDAGWAAAV